VKPPPPGGLRELSRRGAQAVLEGLGFLWSQSAALDLRILGRTLLHTALVGGIAGLVGAAFFAGLELAQRLLLEGLAGYAPLRARGETFLPPFEGRAFRVWALVLLPALGGLASGLLTWRFAPEAAGGGGDATVEAYHRGGGIIRRRVIPVKMLAAICTLASGGSGGREGPTMQIGGAIGSLVGRWLPTSARERRVLFVAGVAAGISAVFRTPLGAALLAVEMLYRDDFEADALVPAILGSVVAYSVVITVFGETTLFGHPARFPFVPAHLPLYGLLALVAALAGVAFLSALRRVQGVSARLPLPVWARPAAGGLAMGLLGTGLALWLRARLGGPGLGLGVFGGGYGAAQVALSGGPGLPQGWELVALFLALASAKLVAASLTIGSGAAAGDFAPSIVMGGLLGAAYGHAAALLLHDPRIQPAAFALVGMGTFFGGIAHAPLSALVLVSELAGSYDLLVPMMLAVGVAFVVLRKWSLYPAQPRTHRQSPVHRSRAAPALENLRAVDVLVPLEVHGFQAATPYAEVVRRAAAAERQSVFPVLGEGGRLAGLVDLDPLRVLGPERDLEWAVAADLMVPFVSVAPDDSLQAVAEKLAENGLRQLPVVFGGRAIGLLGEAEIAQAFLAAVGSEAAKG